eukprot:m.20421 g.20421  ORF g.20421 m.20421 type:complete len:102 (+) comp6844_c0_seq1:934-1239(+)
MVTQVKQKHPVASVSPISQHLPSLCSYPFFVGLKLVLLIGCWEIKGCAAIVRAVQWKKKKEQLRASEFLFLLNAKYSLIYLLIVIGSNVVNARILCLLYSS